MHQWKSLRRVQLFVPPWTIQPMEFSRIQEWVAFPFFGEPSQPRNPGLPHCRWILLAEHTREALEYCCLHCRQILFRPNCQGSPNECVKVKVKVKVAQLCSTLWDPMEYTVHGILQARTLEWVAFPFSRGSSQSKDGTQVSHIAGRFFTS